jgi:hypothetical protein
MEINMNKFLAISSILASTIVATGAFADFKLDAHKGAIICTADDNQSWTINKARTSIKYMVEGETNGAKRITHRESDGDSYVAYRTSEGTLYLDDQGDRFVFSDSGEEGAIDCKRVPAKK